MEKSAKQFLQQILETSSPSGYEQPVQEIVRKWDVEGFRPRTAAVTIADWKERFLDDAENGKRLWLAGIDDILVGAPDLDRTLKDIPREEPVLLMAHEPDFAVESAQGDQVDLQLSGHSHGGQVRVPIIGPTWLPPLGRRYPRGMYHIRNLTLYTNVGLGTVRIPVRFNCPPEITLITLRKGSGQKG